MSEIASIYIFSLQYIWGRKMACCHMCNNVQTAYIIGKGTFIISLLGCFMSFLSANFGRIIIDAFNALEACILIFGAKKRNRCAILIWMVMAFIQLIAVILALIFAILIIVKPEAYKMIPYKEIILPHDPIWIVDYKDDIQSD